MEFDLASYGVIIKHIGHFSIKTPPMEGQIFGDVSTVIFRNEFQIFLLKTEYQ